jgi:hypothetical protein
VNIHVAGPRDRYNEMGWGRGDVQMAQWQSCLDVAMLDKHRLLAPRYAKVGSNTIMSHTISLSQL